MSRTTALIVLLLLPLTVACDKVALLAPTESTIFLSVNTTTLALNGTAEVTATVIEAAGTPVHNGTEVTFTSTVGTMDPRTARTEGGVARSTFRANTQSGIAQISAFSGGARVTEPVEIRVGTAAAETVRVRTEPSTVSQTGGEVQVIATVSDAAGNPLPSVQVSFSANAGTLSTTSATTDATGEARTTLRTNRETRVTVTVAGKTPVEVTVPVVNSPAVALSLTGGTTPTAGVPFSVTVTPTAGGNPTANVTVDFDDGTPPRSLGPITTAQAVPHTYLRADTFNIRATITDSRGESATTTLPVVVQRANIGVSISASPNPATVNEQVTFTVTIQSAQNGPAITSVVVTFSDGTPPATLGTNNSQTFQRSFATPGEKTAIVTVRDAAGTQQSSSVPFTVRARAALEVNVDANSADPNFTVTCLPQTGYPKFCTATPSSIFVIATTARVQFTATVTGIPAGDSIREVVWQWDDGTPPETTPGRSNDHAFPRFRQYTINVIVTTIGGSTGNGRITLQVN